MWGISSHLRSLSKIIKLKKLLICEIFGGYVILIKNTYFPTKTYSLLLYTKDLIIVSFMTVNKNQLKK